MLFQLDIYNSLTGCAASCDEFASRCARCNDDYCREVVMLGLDCADLCRQVALVYRRNMVSAQDIIRTCMAMCKRLTDGARHIDGPLANRVAVACELVRRNCELMLQATCQYPATVESTPAVCYGVVMTHVENPNRAAAYPAA